MNIHTIDIAGGYSGSVVVKTGICTIEFPHFEGTMSSGKSEIKYYHLWLLTPEKTNMELQLFRFADGEWCDSKFFGDPKYSIANTGLLTAIKTVLIKMGI